MTIERVVVTGTAGFVGWHVSAALRERGASVVGVDAFDPFYDADIKRQGLAAFAADPGFAFHEADVRDTPRMAGLLRGADAVIHLAARPGVRQSVTDPGPYHEQNLVGTRRLLEACAAAGVRRIVFASSSSVYGRGVPIPFREDGPLGPPASPYAATKQAGETMVREHAGRTGAAAAVLRLFSVYGPRQRPDLALARFTELLRQGRPVPMFGDGGSERDYTHASDVARGLLQALDWTRGREGGAEVFNLGAGHPVRLDYVIRRLADCLGTEPRWERKSAHPADLPVTCADTTKARAVLGFAPRVALDEGIADYVEWHEREHGRQPCSTA